MEKKHDFTPKYTNVQAPTAAMNIRQHSRCHYKRDSGSIPAGMNNLHTWRPAGRQSPDASPTTPSASPALRASGSLTLMAGSRPPQGDTNESLPAVAFALGPSLLLSSHPRRRSLPHCWCIGCRRATQSSLSRRPSGVEVVHTRGSGIGVPFVMAP